MFLNICKRCISWMTVSLDACVFEAPPRSELTKCFRGHCELNHNFTKTQLKDTCSFANIRQKVYFYAMRHFKGQSLINDLCCQYFLLHTLLLAEREKIILCFVGFLFIFSKLKQPYCLFLEGKDVSESIKLILLIS